jgi:transposase
LKIFEEKVDMDIHQEQVGDLIVLGQVLKQSGLVEILDEHYSLHGNWQGPSVGQLTLGWLMYILSECDHRLSEVESWAERHILSLRWATGYEQLQAGHFQDDRLGRILEYFSEPAKWEAFHSQLNRHLLRIYDLRPRIARLDSVNVTSFRDAEGLFQFGARKKHQAELPQLKVMLASLDPLGMPICCQTIGGHRADDQLYLPAIKQAQQSLPGQGMLYVGDSKLGNLANFASIAASDNYYLCPLSQKQYPPEQLANSLMQMQEQGPALAVSASSQEDKILALVYELAPLKASYTDEQGQDFSWTQRLFLVQSPEHARRQQDQIRENIRQAKITIAERFLPKQGRKTLRVDDWPLAEAFVDQVLKKYKVQHLLEVQLQAGIVQDKALSAPLKVHIQENTTAIQQALHLKGWRVFATNAAPAMLDAAEMIRCYHNEYLIEQQFHRLLTKATALMPLFLRKDNRIEALIRLLCLALQLGSIMQHTARQNLKNNQQALTGIVPGNPGRKVKQPTCEAMLKAFCAVAVVWVVLAGQIQPKVLHLRPVNTRILIALGLNPDLYLHFALSFKDVKELTINLSEP